MTSVCGNEWGPWAVVDSIQRFSVGGCVVVEAGAEAAVVGVVFDLLPDWGV